MDLNWLFFFFAVIVGLDYALTTKSLHWGDNLGQLWSDILIFLLLNNFAYFRLLLLEYS